MENYKEKYEKALDWIRSVYPTMSGAEKEDAEHFFPELIEDEDERIKSCIRICITDTDEQRFMDFNTTLKDCLAWLEKQGEQKPADWSEEDEKMWLQVINEMEAIKANSSTIFEKNIAQDKIDWLKSLKSQNRLKSSEVKNETKNKCPNYSEGYGCSTSPLKQCDTCPDYKLYNHWKPSDEQIDALETAVSSLQSTALKSLYNELKNDLFFAEEEEELTEFEKCLKSNTNIYVEHGIRMEDCDAKNDAKELLDLARKEIQGITDNTCEEIVLSKVYDEGYKDGKNDAGEAKVKELVTEFEKGRISVLESLPKWKKSEIPNVEDCTGFNGVNFCYKGYYINYHDLFDKLPKEE